MKKQEVLEALSKMRDASKKRNFQQSVDLTINFKGIDFKKPENRIDLDVKMPHGSAKKLESIAFVKDKDFVRQLEGIVSRIIMDSEIPNLSKKEIQEISDSFDVLMAEGSVMLTVGKYLGQTLAPRGKMPKPITQELKSVQNLIHTSSGVTKITNKKGKFMPLIHVSVGKEIMQDEDLAENVLAVYDAVESKLPARNQNIKSVLVKLTMSPPIKIGENSKEEAKK